MTARPGRIKEILQIDMPHPRKSDRFRDYERTLYAELDEELAKSFSADRQLMGCWQAAQSSVAKIAKRWRLQARKRPPPESYRCAASDDGQSDGKRPDRGAGQTDLGYAGEPTVAAKITERIHQRVTRRQWLALLRCGKRCRRHAKNRACGSRSAILAWASLLTRAARLRSSSVI